MDFQLSRVPSTSTFIVNNLLYVISFWSLLNLLPVFPLDGGQISVLFWSKGTRNLAACKRCESR